MFATHLKLSTIPLLMFATSSIPSKSAADADADSTGTESANLAAETAPRAAGAASGQVAIVDQRHGVMIFDLASQNWNSEKPSWSWSPRGDGWNNLSDVKFRSYGGRNTLLVTASGGRAATIDHATRRVTWTATPGGNPHSIELLPSGAVVVASSQSGRITVYGKGHQTSDSHVALPDAHAVQWDPKLRQLWALGGSQLCRYSVEGSEARPKLKRVGCVATPPGGHDLSTVHGSPAEMWLSTREHVYIYSISSARLREAPGYIDNKKIKSVGNQPVGLVITTQVKGKNSDDTWGTGNVWLYRQDGSYVGNRYRARAAIYKARPVVWDRR